MHEKTAASVLLKLLISSIFVYEYYNEILKRLPYNILILAQISALNQTRKL